MTIQGERAGAPMKVLIASTPQKFRRTRLLWLALGKLAAVNHEVLGEGAYADLRDLARRCDFTGYDRVIIDHNLRRMGAEYRHLKRIPNPIIFDFDFCQNYIPEVGYNGKLESVLKAIGPHRIIVSSVFIQKDLQSKGFDAEYSPKAYDSNIVRDLGLPRDIELGFIGRTKTRAYSLRRALLARLEQDFGLKILRTEENDEYNQTLNRIQIFISPDHGYHELMIKNFEAMAAGCLLLTSRLPEEELRYLGFRDLENVVLYDHYEQLAALVAKLRSAPGLTSRIAQAGRKLAETRHRWEDRALPLLRKMQPALRPPPALSWRDRWALLLLSAKKSKYTA
jgi:glycosyltransferase involved in cell wall biosynthesis